MKKSNNIVHLITPFLFHTGPWVYSQITGVKKFTNYVFTQERKNEDQFPYSKVISADDLNIPEKYLNKQYAGRYEKYGLFFKRYLKEINPLLFHAHFGYEAVRWLNFVKRTKLPLITTFYGLDVSQLGQIESWRIKYRELFKYGTYFLAEGSYLRKQLIDLGCPAEKAIIQHLGVDVSKYPLKTDYSNQGKIKILQVSTFREKKGIEYSLKALSIVKNNYSDFVFNLIGAGDDSVYEEKLKTLIKELGLVNQINMMGIKTHEEMITEILNSDIFLHPSVTAQDGDNEGGAPVSLIESGALGLPVVSTFHADIPEVVLNEQTGLLVPERDPAALAEKLLLLISSPDLRQKYGTNGRRHIEENYNLNDLIKNLEQLYSTIL